MSKPRSLLRTRGTIPFTLGLLAGGAALIALVVVLGNISANKSLSEQASLSPQVLQADAQSFADAAAQHNVTALYRAYDAHSRSLASEQAIATALSACTRLTAPATVDNVSSVESQGFITVHEKRGTATFATYWDYASGAWHYSLGRSNPVLAALASHQVMSAAPARYCGF